MRRPKSGALRHRPAVRRSAADCFPRRMMKLPVVGQLLVEPAVAEGYFNRIFARNEQGGNVKNVVVDGFIVGGKGRSQKPTPLMNSSAFPEISFRTKLFLKTGAVSGGQFVFSIHLADQIRSVFFMAVYLLDQELIV